MSGPPVVLVVDDEVRSLEALRRVLEEEFVVLTARSAEEAEAVLGREWVHVILCDQRMPGQTGVEFLRRVREQWPDVVRMILSGYTDSEDIIAAVNEGGIYEYITKPWDPDELVRSVRRGAELHRLQRENRALALELRMAEPTLARAVAEKGARLRRRFGFDAIVRGEGSPLEALCRLAARIAAYDIPVLLTGESGTGKELLARAIHYASPRSGRPFVVENCGALPDQLLESELFGHKRGAFTGAFADHEGLFAQADGGTLFLDEIGEVSPTFQVKLLRVLQEGEFRPLGASRPRRADVRIIAATNRDLEAEVRAGRFREDLFYRIAGFVLEVPPLRARPMDIAPLAQHALEAATRRFGKEVQGFAPETLACLEAYPWPGNARQLVHEVNRMVALADGPVLGPDLLSPSVLHARAAPRPDPVAEEAAGTGGGLRERVEALERRILYETLVRHRWNKSRAAEELGLSRVGLRSKLQRYGLDGDRRERA
ncbi:sigma-54-dependent transcriptional regulator [Inmirania thermothiophila]|uniref:Two-component system response regulator HupR/HoxA n=1 Tax=Inmirania thermothiophila TaxID=1750597 RepID=A0A3N1Y4J3_9GAMM|nr:sigma-54 dependent transcriptional regulator [Inmirania thermothiophila]ROR32522.1 two-component system response regulator HupR/HoxA [Inmirania thermothiophila]